MEFGVRTCYQSDYDILIVVSMSSVKRAEDRLRRVTSKYHKLFEGRRHASPQFIVEHINSVNNNLELSQYFFTDIIKEGIMLYDSNKCFLVKPRQLSFTEIRNIAREEFDSVYPYGERFLKLAQEEFSDGLPNVSAFLLHQVCEKFYTCILLVYTNYRPKNHKINELAGMVKRFSMELVNVFPLNTDFEKTSFTLLCNSYIEARYNRDFTITSEQLKYLISRAEILRDMTHRLCTEKLAEYEGMVV